MRTCRAESVLILLAALAMAPAWSLDQLPPNFRTLETFAEQGDADAQFFIGRFFYQQLADPEAADRARQWLTRSAEQNHAHAMLLLGELLELAYGRAADLGESMSWYSRAADMGLAEAQLRLGNFHFRGMGGVEQDCTEALHWYEKAMARGIDVAEDNIVWLLATCPDEQARDGRRAVRMGMAVVYTKGRATANNLDNLAAAFAESGDFRSAWETQQDALEQLPADHGDRPGFEARLAAYQNKQAWREQPFSESP